MDVANSLGVGNTSGGVLDDDSLLNEAFLAGVVVAIYAVGVVTDRDGRTI